MEGDKSAPPGCAVSVVDEHLSVYLKLQGTLDVTKELEKICKRTGDLERQREKLEQVMGMLGYREKVLPQVHQDNVARLASLLQEMSSLRTAALNLEAESS